MFFRNLTLKKNAVLSVTPVHVMLPVRLGNGDASTVFAEPLAAQLAAAGLGGVAECRARLKTCGEPEGVDLFLALTDVSNDALQTVVRMLEHLGAPKGSSLRPVDGGPAVTFGRAVGIGIYVDSRAAAGNEKLQRVTSACVDALGETAILQGTARVEDRIALYFYGRDYKSMKTALARRLKSIPELQSAVTRRLI